MSDNPKTKKKLKQELSKQTKTSPNNQTTKQTNNQANQAMAAIMMPSTFDAAIKEMLIEAQLQAVAALAAKYGFDKDEAVRELNLGEIKLVRKRGPVANSEEKPVTKKAKKEAKEAKTDKDGKPKAKRGPTGYLL